MHSKLNVLRRLLNRDPHPAPGELMRSAGVVGGGFHHGEEHLAEDVRALDRTDPDWDEAQRVEDAVLRLRRGLSVRSAVAIFGEPVARQALELLSRSPLSFDAEAATAYAQASRAA
jgi:hypothetical protein